MSYHSHVREQIIEAGYASGKLPRVLQTPQYIAACETVLFLICLKYTKLKKKEKRKKKKEMR